LKPRVLLPIGVIVKFGIIEKFIDANSIANVESTEHATDFIRFCYSPCEHANLNFEHIRGSIC
jgi:hypothetical protein